jgi:hypothetical protein
MDLGNLVLWGIGIVISILLAFFGVTKIYNRKSQNAKADNGSNIIQSGRDTNLK